MHLVVAFILLAQELSHFDTIEKAVEAARTDKKDILVDFTGSDWCGWCIKLHDEVFSQEAWKKAAAGKYVFVELDFPRKKEQSEAARWLSLRRIQSLGLKGHSDFIRKAQPEIRRPGSLGLLISPYLPFTIYSLSGPSYRE